MKRILAIAMIVAAAMSCEKEQMQCPGETQKQFAATDFHALKVGETFGATISRGDQFSVVGEGCAEDLNDLNISVDAGGTLEIKYKKYRRNRYRVDLMITLPRLQKIILDGTAKASVTGFQGREETFTAILSGASVGTIDGAMKNTLVDLRGTAKLSVTGNCESLKGSVSEASRLNAFEATASDVDMTTSGSAEARVFVVEKLYALATAASKIFYKGNPPVKTLDVREAAKIETSLNQY